MVNKITQAIMGAIRVPTLTSSKSKHLQVNNQLLFKTSRRAKVESLVNRVTYTRARLSRATTRERIPTRRAATPNNQLTHL